ncbi:MAG: hypothetical protein KBD64_04705 [Gammaproteobacteria bacterium]|nr:hypothetical protein [Gammaproteobacteria bacterium]
MKIFNYINYIRQEPEGPRTAASGRPAPDGLFATDEQRQSLLERVRGLIDFLKDQHVAPRPAPTSARRASGDLNEEEMGARYDGRTLRPGETEVEAQLKMIEAELRKGDPIAKEKVADIGNILKEVEDGKRAYEASIKRAPNPSEEKPKTTEEKLEEAKQAVQQCERSLDAAKKSMDGIDVNSDNPWIKLATMIAKTIKKEIFIPLHEAALKAAKQAVDNLEQKKKEENESQKKAEEKPKPKPKPKPEPKPQADKQKQADDRLQLDAPPAPPVAAKDSAAPAALPPPTSPAAVALAEGAEGARGAAVVPVPDASPQPSLPPPPRRGS